MMMMMKMMMMMMVVVVINDGDGDHHITIPLPQATQAAPDAEVTESAMRLVISRPLAQYDSGGCMAVFEHYLLKLLTQTLANPSACDSAIMEYRNGVTTMPPTLGVHPPISHYKHVYARVVGARPSMLLLSPGCGAVETCTWSNAVGLSIDVHTVPDYILPIAKPYIMLIVGCPAGQVAGQLLRETFQEWLIKHSGAYKLKLTNYGQGWHFLLDNSIQLYLKLLALQWKLKPFFNHNTDFFVNSDLHISWHPLQASQRKRVNFSNPANGL